jgi:hypothetical protein
VTAKKNPAFVTQTYHVMQHLLAWRLPQLSSMVNAAAQAPDGCGEATTVGFFCAVACHGTGLSLMLSAKLKGWH